MVDTAKMAKLLERFAQGVAAHDRENPDHNSWGIGMAQFDIERLDLEEGEQILPGDQIAPEGAEGFLLNAMNCTPEVEAEFNEWYNTEHIPQLAAVPGVIMARRFRATSANRKYVALYHLESPDVQASAAWKNAANTPWTEKLRLHFRDHLRLVCRKYLRGK